MSKKRTKTDTQTELKVTHEVDRRLKKSNERSLAKRIRNDPIFTFSFLLQRVL